MVFSSYIFLFYFLPVCLAIYFLLPRAARNLFLVFVSIFFFSFGEPRFTPILLFLCGIDFILGIKIGQYLEQDKRSHARYYLYASITLSLLVFFYAKYANFFVGEVSRVLMYFGYEAVPWTKVILPLGISFFTFHKISYVVDIYRGISQPLRNPLLYALYILFFPQLIAGPIIRYHEISDQLYTRRCTLDDVYNGFYRFVVGLAKKVIIADVVGRTADQIFLLQENQLTPAIAWCGIIAYTSQIYFDFSGYSDMAIGLARMFGFHFPENFNAPYIARSFTDFWRRWHMSLGRWMREYLYIPLGGNKCGTIRQYINLWIVFFLSGFWHGAEWTFILWGIFHGIFLTFDKLFLIRWTEKWPILCQVLFTLFFVTLSRVLFRADTLEQSMYFYKALFGLNSSNMFVLWGTITSRFEITMICMSYVICLWPVLPGNKIIAGYVNRYHICNHAAVKGIYMIFLLLMSSIVMASSQFSPFIYFQF